MQQVSSVKQQEEDDAAADASAAADAAAAAAADAAAAAASAAAATAAAAAASGSTDTSRWSTPSKGSCGCIIPQYSSDSDDQADCRNPEAKSANKLQGSELSERKKSKRSVDCRELKLPPIRSQQASSQRIQPDNLICIRELRNQVGELQQQLTEAQSENKLLKRLQHRHTVALQRFQDLEGSISEIASKHSNEARVLRALLRDTRTCRDGLGRQLQASENTLMNTKDNLQHLQLLSHNHSLLEREELTCMVDQATAELEEKDKRILDLEKNLHLCQASFNRQLGTEQKKLTDERSVSCHLREHMVQLTHEVHDRGRKLEAHNIYFHRFLERKTKKESKMVQTDEIQEEAVGLRQELLEIVNPNPPDVSAGRENKMVQTDEIEEKQIIVLVESCEIEKPEFPVEVTPEGEEPPPEDCDVSAEESSQHEEEDECTEEEEEEEQEEEEEEEEETPPVVVEEPTAEEDDSEGKSATTSETKSKGGSLAKARQIYNFTQIIENLHKGRPAYSNWDASPCEGTEGPRRAEASNLAAGEPSGGGDGGGAQSK